MKKYNEEVKLTKELISVAREFAVLAHGEQMYGEHPYSKHLDDVFDVLVKFGYSAENDNRFDNHLAILIASFLHDVTEDKRATYNQLISKFGYIVARIVYCVSDGDGMNRKEKHRNTYPKLRSNHDSIVVKLADRIANVTNCINTENHGLYEMYWDEFTEFQDELRIWSHCKDSKVLAMWEHLNSLFKL